jgi:putative photosynthetic complex assembly protein
MAGEPDMNTTANNRPVAADTFPRWVPWFGGALIAFSLISVGLVRITGNGPDQLAAAVTQERSLRFLDRADGGVDVIDGSTGDTVTVLRGEQGFVRGALRALARERQARKLGPEQPFVLTAHADNRLTLTDPTTGERIDLESFGSANTGEFARLLAPALKP